MKTVIFMSILMMIPAGFLCADVHVHDSEGQYLGLMVNSYPEMCCIYEPTAGVFFNLIADSDNPGFMTIKPPELMMYETSDCSGPAYVEPAINGYYVYECDDATLKTAGPEKTVAVRSYRTHCGDCLTQASATEAAALEAIPAQAIFSGDIKGPLTFSAGRIDGDMTGDQKVDARDAAVILQKAGGLK